MGQYMHERWARMNTLAVVSFSLMVVVVMFLIGYVESRRELPRNEKDERPHYRKAA
jgi:hypothetical protein